MAEYMEANRNEILDKLMKDNRQVTLLVFRDGDQLNFFRVYDRGDGTLTPMSESVSAASMYNLYDEEDEDDRRISKERKEENDQTKQKMQVLQAQLANLNIKRKATDIPHPPSRGRPNSNLARRRLRFAAKGVDGSTKPSVTTDEVKRVRRHRNKPKHRVEETDAPIANNKLPLPPVTSKNRHKDNVDISEILGTASLESKMFQELKHGNSAESERTLSSRSGIKDLTRRSGRGTKSLAPLNIRGSSGETDLKRELPACTAEETPIREDQRMNSMEDSNSKTSLESTVHRKSSKLKSLGDSKRYSPDSGKRLLRKSRLAAVEESIVGLTREVTGKGFKDTLIQSKLPQVEIKSTAPPQLVPNSRKRARCFKCSKKLGLATNYKCRCGNMYCAAHRYAETHNCTYDYKGEGRKVLEQSNPVVTAPKLPKI